MFVLLVLFSFIELLFFLSEYAYKLLKSFWGLVTVLFKTLGYFFMLFIGSFFKFGKSEWLGLCFWMVVWVIVLYILAWFIGWIGVNMTVNMTFPRYVTMGAILASFPNLYEAIIEWWVACRASIYEGIFEFFLSFVSFLFALFTMSWFFFVFMVFVSCFIFSMCLLWQFFCWLYGVLALLILGN